MSAPSPPCPRCPPRKPARPHTRPGERTLAQLRVVSLHHCRREGDGWRGWWLVERQARTHAGPAAGSDRSARSPERLGVSARGSALVGRQPPPPPLPRVRTQQRGRSSLRPAHLERSAATGAQREGASWAADARAAHASEAAPLDGEVQGLHDGWLMSTVRGCWTMRGRMQQVGGGLADCLCRPVSACTPQSTVGVCLHFPFKNLYK